MLHKPLEPIWFCLNKRTRVFVWSGGWAIFDRSAVYRFSLHQCDHHRFSLYIGPFGIEIDHKDKEPCLYEMSNNCVIAKNPRYDSAEMVDESESQ